MAETKEARLGVIREILDAQAVSNQDALVALLEERGFAVTQSSVSRDLRDLRVAKVAGEYRLPHALRSPEALALEGIISVRRAGDHMLVVHTVVGGASRVALGIDNARWAEVVGTLAGDDTIFVATESRAQQDVVVDRLSGLSSNRERREP